MFFKLNEILNSEKHRQHEHEKQKQCPRDYEICHLSSSHAANWGGFFIIKQRSVESRTIPVLKSLLTGTKRPVRISQAEVDEQMSRLMFSHRFSNIKNQFHTPNQHYRVPTNDRQNDFEMK
ncbi:hypothetical protein T10_8866 [Trichinella papuae]|uniref:Uncharacterized protein n=1 Tax=Trichinella papuae TaxID=268474 RepID=A0A0V1MJ84_9BILA|nr:hypothetical protein T10_8866 [Trichinella papuae]